MTPLNYQNELPPVALPQTSSIDTTLGLKHCNQNRALYFKILNSFVKRYQHIDLHHLEDRERTLHSLKGLSATLGMNSLNKTIIELEESFEPTYINNFEHELSTIIKEIINL